MFAYKIVFNVYKCSRWLSMVENGMVRCMSTHYFEKRPLVTYVPAAKYGGRHTVTMIPGDGLGPELMGHVKQVFRAAAVPVDFEEVLLDSQHDSEEDLDNAVLAVKRNKVALKGNVETYHAEPGFISHNLLLRVRLDLQANIVHCRSVPGVRSRHADINVVVIRENTEGEYKSLEHENVPGVVESLKIITREHSESIAHYAFQYALDHGRKKVTAVHKANIMKLADGMFLDSCRRVAAQYPSVQFQDMIVDNTCMQLVSRPQQFDVMVMPNLYGNIVANIGVGIAGGDGLTAGANIGPQYAIFETGTRSTGKSITGQNTANPTAMLLAGVKLCRYLGLSAHADVIESAIWKTISDDKVHTPDLGGLATTSDVLDSITQKIGAHMASR